MVTATFIYPEVDSRWLKYIALSVLANVLIASFISIGNLPQKLTEIPMLKVNLMALAAPSSEQIKASIKQAPPPAAMQKMATEKQAMKKVAVAKAQPKSIDTPSKEVPVLQKRKEVAAKPVTSNPNHNSGKQASTVIHEASYRRQTSPVYPHRALELGQEGVVTLHAEVNKNGLPRALKIAKSSGHRLLDMAALAAVKKWEFEPTNVNGNSVISWLRVPVSFVIQR
jgi:protein TonB